jgi:hypothetical protein
MNKIICLVLAFACFAIGSFNKLAGSDFNWTNAGLAFATLSFIVP